MKISAMVMVWITTALLVVLTVLAHTAIGFNWLFYLTMIGHIFIVIMVYKVLRDNFVTDKTFDNYFYQDHHIQRTKDEI